MSVSTAMHGLIGLDADDATAHARCSPGPTPAPATRRGSCATAGLAAGLQRTSGTPVHSMIAADEAHVVLPPRAGPLRAVRWWVGLKDYVLWHLTGTLVTELSSASGTGLLDIATRSLESGRARAGRRVRGPAPAGPAHHRHPRPVRGRGRPDRAARRHPGRARRRRRTARKPRHRRDVPRGRRGCPWAPAGQCAWSCRSRGSTPTARSSATR